MDRWELSWPWLLCAAACAWVRLKQSWGSNLSESGSERVVWNTGPIIGFTPQATQLGLHQLGSSKSTWSELLSCLHSFILLSLFSYSSLCFWLSWGRVTRKLWVPCPFLAAQEFDRHKARSQGHIWVVIHLERMGDPRPKSILTRLR